MSHITKRKIIPGILLLIALLPACKKEEQSRFQNSWSSKDPVLIPYNIRNNEKELGNLITNSSFETGKIYYEKNSYESFDIDGWKKIGDNIEWVNSENNKYHKNEAFNGKHSIKITIKTADETEHVGTGILSNFIKVIPGNYFFKMHLKLKNICPNQARIGTKMYDAVNIRLQYFDKNKIEIKGIEYNPFQKNKIDNTFKSFTLSNYHYIDSLGWGLIHGKTSDFNLMEGDIPDKARYVKIFIGLKGSGTMWIDNVDFRYTDRNFTLKEKLLPYFDSSYSVYDLIYPTPRKLSNKELISLSKKKIFILLPTNANNELKELAVQFKNILSIDNEIIVQIHDKIKNIKDLNNQLAISIGKTSLYSKNKHLLPDTILANHKQSYYIKTLKNNQQVIYINASCNQSFINSYNTFKQLIAQNNDLLYLADIIDYPDYLQRDFIVDLSNDTLNIKQKIKQLQSYKFNLPYFQVDINNQEKSGYKDLIYSLNTEYNLILNTINKEGEDISGNGIISYTNNLFNHKKYPGSIIISACCKKDYNHCYVTQKIYKINFKQEIQKKHIKLLNTISDYLQTEKINSKIEFISPWNRLDLINKGMGQAEFYYYDLKNNIPANIPIYWTGGSYSPTSVDFAESKRIQYITKRKPLFIDNSLKNSEDIFKSREIKEYYAGKLRVYSLFEPYNLKTYENFYNDNPKRKIILNSNSVSELSTIRMLTALNYYWNTNNYNPHFSLWLVLEKLYGKENAKNLVVFNDAYFGLYEACQKIKSNGLQHKYLRIASGFENKLNQYFNLLENGITNQNLLKEIKLLKTELIDIYNTTISNNN